MFDKEVITVRSGFPRTESKSSPNEKNQIYQGHVNLLSIIHTKKDILCCKYTEDNKDIAVGFPDGTIKLFDTNNGSCTHNLVDAECRAHPAPVTAIKHRPHSDTYPITNTLLSTYVNGCIKCWKYKCNQCLYTIREKRQALGLNYHPRVSKLVTYGDDSKINMYNEETQTLERAFHGSNEIRRDGHTSRIFACDFHPLSSHEFISGGWDDHVMCWDDRQPYPTKHFRSVHMCGEGLNFDKTGKEILTCSWQDKNNIQMWDYATCKVIETIVPDNVQSKLYCGKLVPKTNLIICGGSQNNVLRLIDAKLKVTLCSVRNNPSGILGFDLGTVRRKPKVANKVNIPNEIQDTPRVAFITGKQLQTVDFG